MNSTHMYIHVRALFQEQISELREVIQTLEIDVNEAKRELQVVEMQSKSSIVTATLL